MTFWICPRLKPAAHEINPTTFALKVLLTDLENMFRLRAEAKGLQFEMAVEDGSVPYVLADEGKIRQALINLLGNAIRYEERPDPASRSRCRQ